MKDLGFSDYKHAFDELLELKDLRGLYYKNLQHDKADFFQNTPVEHWLVMAFNWARVFSVNVKSTKDSEAYWKRVDLNWRVALQELRE